ncbi:hypothetical protein [uncultured Pseudokineococcus sp.]|uniref:hypothetical protein n=1 Tax=uncultured Pseudokineococcus sp. TaxID=1642928 RepID=UPI002603FDA8|nr:hypothetical protein [uncultured Pseudokineococcus sp.]
MLTALLFLSVAVAVLAAVIWWKRGQTAPGRNTIRVGDNHLEMTDAPPFVLLVALIAAIVLVFRIGAAEDQAAVGGEGPPVAAPAVAPPTSFPGRTAMPVEPPTKPTTSPPSEPGEAPRDQPSSTTAFPDAEETAATPAGGPPWSAEQMDVRLVVERIALDDDATGGWSARVRVENLSDSPISWATSGWLFVDAHGQSYPVDEDLSSLDLGRATYLQAGEVKTGEVMSVEKAVEAVPAVDVRLNFSTGVRYSTVSVTVEL